MKSTIEPQFLQFLENDLAIAHDSIALALRYVPYDCSLLPIILWKYGLADLDQLNSMFDWLENV